MFPAPGRRSGTLGLLLTCLAVAGCAAPAKRDPRDPFEPMNRAVYRFNHQVDRFVAQPAARVYVAVTPQIARTGLRNFFQNLALPIDIANDLFQGKPGAAARDSGRLVLNTVIGMGGLFDVATDVGLPDPDEDFGQTLGVWGFGSGPYLMLPFLGPTTLRDGIGEIGADNNYLDPIRNHTPKPERYNAKALELLQKRADLLGSEALLEDAYDPYLFLRNAYLQRREFLVHDGDPPADPDEDPYALPDEDGPPGQAALSDEGQQPFDV